MKIHHEIIHDERNKLLKNKINSTIYQKFSQDSQMFMNYLEIDSKMRKAEGLKKLQDFKNANIEASIKKTETNPENW